ncbi:hypothetical protein R3P38DRAFT_3245057 [Favolaschia claudopus]|uniref:Uncharacterized protein n=1 Tax=Favolaschia claudopus TaxID=2862362 RepID=A0AAV9Z127_9AGAR
MPNSSSSPLLPNLRLASPQPPSPTLSELEILEILYFGHPIAPLHHPPNIPSASSLISPTTSHVDIPSHSYATVNSHDTSNPTLLDPNPTPHVYNLDSPVEESPAPAFRQPTAAFSVAATPPITRTRRATPVVPVAPVVSAAPADPIPDLINFEVLIWLPGIPPKPVGRSKSKRVVKVDPASFGPVLCTTDMAYDDFMEAIAETLHTTPEFLVIISSAEWKHLRPANAPWFPLRDQSGYQSLHRKIITPPKGVSAHDIIVRMNTPMQAPAKQMMPQKKVPFDEALEDERSRNHFELDRPKLLVWAAMIKSKQCTIDCPPLGSNLFQADKTIKKKASTSTSTSTAAVAPPPSPATPAPFPPSPAAPQLPYGYPYGYNAPAPPFPSPMAFPPFGMYGPSSYYGHGGMPAPWYESPRHRRRRRSWDGGSSPPSELSKKRHRNAEPPSSPIPVGGSIDEFVKKYPNLPEQTGPFLTDLGFQIGDKLSIVKEPDWKEGGFTLFGWNRVVEAYTKYKRSR